MSRDFVRRIAASVSTAAIALAALLVSASSTHPLPAYAAPQASAQTAQPLELPRLVSEARVAAQAAPAAAAGYVTVRPGDTLSLIAARVYGSSRDWPALWWTNRHRVPDPDQVRAGQVLALSGWHPQAAWLLAAAQKAADPAPAAAVLTSYSASSASRGNVSPGDYSGFQACVIERESGGNSQIWNASGHYGLYQFSYPTWVAYGGVPSEFGHATVAEQNQVFYNAMATPDGADNWSPYDHCL